MISQDKMLRDAKRFFNDMKRRGFVKEIEYRSVIAQDYDVTLGQETESYESTVIQAYLTNYTKNELTDQVRSSDLKCIVLEGITPKIDDIVVWNDIEFRVVNFVPNPAEVSIAIQLRAGE